MSNRFIIDKKVNLEDEDYDFIEDTQTNKIYAVRVSSGMELLDLLNDLYKSPCKCARDTKAKYVILTFLTANKNKKFTAKQIKQFMLENKIMGTNLNITDKRIINYIKKDRLSTTGILKNVKIEKIGRSIKFFIM